MSSIKYYSYGQAGNRQLNRELLAYQQMQQHYKGRESAVLLLCNSAGEREVNAKKVK